LEHNVNLRMTCSPSCSLLLCPVMRPSLFESWTIIMVWIVCCKVCFGVIICFQVYQDKIDKIETSITTGLTERSEVWKDPELA